MPTQNYTITRWINGTEDFGCTNFSTVQTQGDVTSVVTGATFDGSIGWQIKANTGYLVTYTDFSILNATLTTVGGTRVFTGGNLPTEVLAVSMVQTSADLIDVIIWFNADAALGVSGGPYTMPTNDVLLKIPIVGCAESKYTTVTSNVSFTQTGTNVAIHAPVVGSPKTSFTSTTSLDEITFEFTSDVDALLETSDEENTL